MDNNKNKNSKSINDLLKHLSKGDANRKGSEAPEAEKNLNAKILNDIVEQYLSPFIIVGYDVNGDCVNIGNIASGKDHDAITTALMRLIKSYDIGDEDDDNITDLFDRV